MLRKKIIIIVVTSICVIVGIFIALHYKSTDTYSANPTQQLLAEALIKNSDKDSDSDGLKDWEEALWHTDPHNPDTDGDGTSDGDEVKQGRNPLVAGPHDKVTIDTTIKISGTDANTNIAETETDTMARDLFTQYMELKKAGTPIDEKTQTILITNLLQNKSLQNTHKTYTSSDIKNITTNTATAMRNYGNRLGRILVADSPKASQNEIVIIEKALTSGNQSDIQQLNPIINGYNTIITNLISVTVPKNALTLHIHLINDISRVRDDIQDMSTTFNDPVKALLSMNDYRQSVSSLVSDLTQIKTYFSNNQITFTQSEYGYALVHTL